MVGRKQLGSCSCSFIEKDQNWLWFGFFFFFTFYPLLYTVRLHCVYLNISVDLTVVVVQAVPSVQRSWCFSLPGAFHAVSAYERVIDSNKIS